jgi:hypothetical protein
MKKLITLSCIAFSLCAFAQYDIKPTIVNVDSSFSKSDVFSSIKVFLSESYVNSKEAIQMSDSEIGVIVIKGTSQNFIKGLFGSSVEAGWWHYTAKFEVKEGKYRFSVYDVKLTADYGTVLFNDDTHESYKNTGSKLLTDLKESFYNIPIKSFSDDW